MIEVIGRLRCVHAHLSGAHIGLGRIHAFSHNRDLASHLTLWLDDHRLLGLLVRCNNDVGLTLGSRPNPHRWPCLHLNLVPGQGRHRPMLLLHLLRAEVSKTRRRSDRGMKLRIARHGPTLRLDHLALGDIIDLDEWVG